MRFSLKWLLAGTVYVAIAAAAFARPHWAYAEALWALTFLAVVYALIVAISGRGQRQVVAIGFAVASLLLTGYVLFGSSNSKAFSRVVELLSPPEPAPFSVVNGRIPVYSLPSGRMTTTPPNVVAASSVLRSANAVGTMAAGLVGAVLGALAYQRGRVEREGE